jgi:adsorption protein B
MTELLMDPVVWLGTGLWLAKLTLIALCLLFLISGLDDLFIDLVYWTRGILRKTVMARRIKPLPASVLARKPEQPIAIMVPAWDESVVLRPMLSNMLAGLDYARYHVFVGVYPNDAATQRELDAVIAEHSKVHRVMVDHPGPTNKADCLNAIFRGAMAYEQAQGERFEIFVMQDCEDVIHPLAWRLFNWLIPRKDMVQLPVMSLPRPWYALTAAHYLDEFAQLHQKDLVVREALDRSMPAAGVGVAFSRRAMLAVARDNQGEPFSTDSLTEDYDFGFRLKRHGFKQVFVRYWVGRGVPGRHWLTGRPYTQQRTELVCVREYFPATLSAAVRQKARWVLGIALQGWRNLGWQGGLATRYMLWRDRKALITHPATMLAYALVIVVCLQWAWRALDPYALQFAPLIEPGSLSWQLLLINLGLLALRLVQRMWFTARLHGPLQGLLAAPRMVWGNLINFLATARALRLWWRHQRTGVAIGWDKTAHQYPQEVLWLNDAIRNPV